MACANTSWSEENFSCSICLDVFSSPVTTTCGHNFCRTCITKFWDEKVQYKCPVCNKLFNTRPDLQVNTFLSELAAQIRTTVRVKEQPCVEPAEVPCDVCTGTQQKAVKSCLVCFTSYCQTHLEPHQRVSRLQKHRLVEPMDRLEDRMCKKHDRLLELFCQTEQVCVCLLCTVTDHKSHPVVPLKEEYEVKMGPAGEERAEVPQKIQERKQKIKEIKDTVELSNKDADREIAHGGQVFTALIGCVEKGRDEFNQTVQEKLKSTVKRAEDLIKELEQEIEDLTNRSSEVKRLSHTEDHLHFLQTFRSLKDPPPTRDWTTVEVRPPSYVGTLRRSLDQLEETLNMEMKKLRDAELKRVQQYEVDVTLDPDTAHPKLILSEDGKQVHDGGMACANTSWSEENFSCSICLDVFNSPVTTTCGHNFCRTCITKFWDEQVQYKCPVCNEIFHTRPDLQVNTFLSELAAQIRTTVRVKEQPCVEPAEVPCDVCTGTQQKAVKSCLVCFTSYCQTHLEPHQRVARLQKHRLVEPMDRLEDRMCKKHDRLLELFCQTEQVCVCLLCTVTDHKSHPVVPLKEEYEVKTAQLGKIEAEVPQKIQERKQKIKEIKDTVELSNKDADREIAHGGQVFTALIGCVEKGRDEFNQTVKEKLKSTVKRAEDLIKELEQEIEDLTNRSSEEKRLSHTEDLLHFLQTFRSLKDPPPTRDWTRVEVRPPSYVGTLRRSLDQLEETLNMEMKKLPDDAELKRVQQYEVDVTLDPDTAHPSLILSEDGKQVHDGGVVKILPYNPKRFTYYTCVLTRQSFSSGRFYFEVQVKDKTAWWLGVARESIDRTVSCSVLTALSFSRSINRSAGSISVTSRSKALGLLSSNKRSPKH
ncbi:unnamed protein product, partial [Gadus morhua 'NCC']